MSDYESTRGVPPNEETPPSGNGTPPVVSPEYVRDLLSRLKETMDVIDGTETVPAVTPSAASVTSDTEEDDLPPWETAEEAEGEQTVVETVPAAAPVSTTPPAVERVRSSAAVRISTLILRPAARLTASVMRGWCMFIS